VGLGQREDGEAVGGVPDGARLAADGLAGGAGEGMVDGVAQEVDLAALPERAGAAARPA
jgi:hypothetical protein